MRDWSTLVSRHLASVRVDDERRAAIGAELAAYLEDACDAAVRRGCTEAEAMASAMALVPDWNALTAALQGSADEESIMTRQASTILLPGTAMLLAAAMGLGLGVTLMPAERWADPRWYAHALAAGFVLSIYVVLGAIGAAWSRRAGGSPWECLAASVFPLVLHLAVAGLGVGEDVLYAVSHGAGGRHLGLDIGRLVLIVLVAPGTALLLGGLRVVRRAAVNAH